MRIRITAFRFFFCTGTCLLYFDGGGAGAGATAVKMGRPGARAAKRGYMVPEPPKGGGAGSAILNPMQRLPMVARLAATPVLPEPTR